MASMLDTIRLERIEKTKKIRELGINPYPSKVDRTNFCSAISEKFTELEGKEITIVGRAMAWRDLGKIIFVNLKDYSGEGQVIIKGEYIDEHKKFLKLLDLGDFLEVTGIVGKSKTGEDSLIANNVKIISKSIRPLPEKWSGIKDEDVKYRQRYLDFITNDESRNKITKRTKVLELIRSFMWEKEFIEIENPSLELTAAGAEAKPFTTHINAYGMDVYLRICAGELWQKMSTVGGFEKVFEIARAYRNEGVDSEHNPEFTMLEFYWAYSNLTDNIDLQEELFRRLAKEITGSEKFEFDGKIIDLSKDIPRTPYNELFIEHAGIDLNKYSDLKELQKVAKEKGAEIEDEMGWYSTVDGIFKHLVRPNIYDPVFVVDYPSYITPLAKRIEGNEEYAYMTQLVIHGMEMTRAYGELNDPIDQQKRFDDQDSEKESGDENTWTADDDYVVAMEYGMPPQSGTGIGIDRLVKVLTDSKSLRDVIAYPIMKPLESNNSKNTEVTKDNDHVKSKGSNNQNLTKKMVLVLDKELEGWQLTNTVGHLSAFLGNKISEDDFTSVKSFETKDDSSIPANSQYPVISMRAKQGQLFNLLKQVEESGLIHLAYAQEMIDFNLDDELALEFKKQNKADMNYLGIGIFGDNETIDKLTKKYSLWK
jgi:lysyl-tRNA synthetase, class II